MLAYHRSRIEGLGVFLLPLTFAAPSEWTLPVFVYITAPAAGAGYAKRMQQVSDQSNSYMRFVERTGTAC